MTKVLLAGSIGSSCSGRLTEAIARNLGQKGHSVTRTDTAADAVARLEGEQDYNLAIVKSLLSVDNTMHSVSCFSGHPAELWVAAACQREGLPCVIFHENEDDDWHVVVAEKYLNAAVVVRPISDEVHPDYEQEDTDFAELIVGAAVNAYHAKIAVPVA